MANYELETENALTILRSSSRVNYMERNGVLANHPSCQENHIVKRLTVTWLDLSASDAMTNAGLQSGFQSFDCLWLIFET